MNTVLPALQAFQAVARRSDGQAMTPYATFFYFGVLLYPLAIGLTLAWFGKLTPPKPRCI